MSGPAGSAGTPGAVPPGTPPGLKPWKPGQSGNPSGRSKQIAEIETLARSHGKAAVARLVEIMNGKNVKEARMAAEALLDRGFGRPAVAVNVTARSAPIDGAFAGAARLALEAAISMAEGGSTVMQTVAPVPTEGAGRNDSAVIDVTGESVTSGRGQAVANGTGEGAP